MSCFSPYVWVVCSSRQTTTSLHSIHFSLSSSSSTMRTQPTLGPASANVHIDRRSPSSCSQPTSPLPSSARATTASRRPSRRSSTSSSTGSTSFSSLSPSRSSPTTSSGRACSLPAPFLPRVAQRASMNLDRLFSFCLAVLQGAGEVHYLVRPTLYFSTLPSSHRESRCKALLLRCSPSSQRARPWLRPSHHLALPSLSHPASSPSFLSPSSSATRPSSSPSLSARYVSCILLPDALAPAPSHLCLPPTAIIPHPRARPPRACVTRVEISPSLTDVSSSNCRALTDPRRTPQCNLWQRRRAHHRHCRPETKPAPARPDLDDRLDPLQHPPCPR